MEGQLGVLAVGPALLGCWGSGFPLGALGDHVGGCLQHPLPSAPVTARGELPPHKLLTGHCDGKQDGGSCHGSSVLSPLPHCRQEPESPLKMSKSPFLTLSVLGCGFLVAVVEVMLGILKEPEWKAVSSRIMAVMSWEPVEAEDCGSNSHDEV